MEWNEAGSPMERASFRLIISLTSYLIGADVIPKHRVIESLNDGIEQSGDEQEANLYRVFLKAIEENRPPNLTVIKGGKDDE